MEIVINGIFIYSKTILLIRKERNRMSNWIFPGGKPQPREEDLDCLNRELKEELPYFKFGGNFCPYCKIRGISSTRNIPLELRAYMFNGFCNNDFRTSSRPEEPIKEARIFNYNDALTLEISDITSRIIQKLKLDNLV